MNKSSHVGRPTLYLSLTTLLLTGVVLGAAFLLSPSKDSEEQKGPQVIVDVSYAITYGSYRKAYEDADLVVLGRVTSVEYHFTSLPYTISHLEAELVIKGELSGRTVSVSQLGVGVDEEKGIYYIIYEDPPLEVGERLLLLLRENKDSPSRNWYWYPGMFGRFEVVDDKVYSMMYELPRLKLLEKYGLPEQERIEKATMLTRTNYASVNGIPLEEFIEMLTTP